MSNNMIFRDIVEKNELGRVEFGGPWNQQFGEWIFCVYKRLLINIVYYYNKIDFEEPIRHLNKLQSIKLVSILPHIIILYRFYACFPTS